MSKSFWVPAVFVFLALSSCYQFEPLDKSVQLQPSLAFPIATVHQNIEGSLVLFGAPEINLEEDVLEWAQHREVFFIDTISFALSDVYQQSHVVRYLVFKLSTWNDFPSSATAQIIFLNSNDEAIDSLFAPSPFGVVPSQIGAMGVVVKRGSSQTEISITQAKIENLRQATRIVIRCSASNVGVPVDYFQYYLSYFLSVKLSVRVGLSLQVE
jgi:hypothetical protein